MNFELQIKPLAEAAALQAAEVLGRAFFTDPAFVFTFPDDEQRRQRLPWLMQIGVRYGYRFGHVSSAEPEMFGHAVWLPPGNGSVAPERMSAVGFDNAIQQMGQDALARFGGFMELMGEHHERIVPTPHWYLMILGVDPPYQGKGIGGSLIAPTLARADAEGLPCYLETANPRNLPFYQRHGFEVRHEADIPGGGPRIWMMLREPR